MKLQIRREGHDRKKNGTDAFSEVITGEEAVVGEGSEAILHPSPELVGVCHPRRRLADEAKTLKRPLCSLPRPFQLRPDPSGIPRRHGVGGGRAGRRGMLIIRRRVRRLPPSNRRKHPRQLAPDPRRRRRAPAQTSRRSRPGGGGSSGGRGRGGDAPHNHRILVELQHHLDQIALVVEKNGQHSAFVAAVAATTVHGLIAGLLVLRPDAVDPPVPQLPEASTLGGRSRRHVCGRRATPLPLRTSPLPNSSSNSTLGRRMTRRRHLRQSISWDSLGKIKRPNI